MRSRARSHAGARTSNQRFTRILAGARTTTQGTCQGRSPVRRGLPERDADTRTNPPEPTPAIEAGVRTPGIVRPGVTDSASRPTLRELAMSRNGTTWQPDGSGWRARIGVLTHDDSAISESELWTMAPAGVSLHTSRVFFADLATFADPPDPDNATELLARLPLQAIIYAWTVGMLPSSLTTSTRKEPHTFSSVDSRSFTSAI